MSHPRSHTVRRSAILATALLTLCALGARAGSLDAPVAPTDPASAMFTLQDIYDRLDDGSAGAKRAGPFVEPTSGPTTGTMQTLDAIMAKLPALDDTNRAAAGDVPQGLTFWGLRSDGWGPQTGTADVAGPPLCSCDCSGYSIWNAASGGTRWCDNGNGTVTDLLGADVGARTTGRCLV